ncbi:MAG: hypothetical protein OXQ92_09175 [Boseongicola sp.]|nr:hypothetical protein [Boseongicola sp.]MDD9978689.1 hypothetical protein [Boseongicola sp.]
MKLVLFVVLFVVPLASLVTVLTIRMRARLLERLKEDFWQSDTPLRMPSWRLLLADFLISLLALSLMATAILIATMVVF